MDPRGAWTHVVAAADAGQRLDRYLRRLHPEVPLSALHRAIRRGEVRLDGARAKASDRLAAGQEIRAPWPPPERPLAAADGELGVPILYEDADLLAVDKPPGLAVHAGSGVRDDLAARIARRYGGRAGRSFRPAPAHRLDRPASGILLAGLSPEGLRGLGALFRARAVEKRYLVVVEEGPGEAAGELQGWLEVLEAVPPGHPKVCVHAEASGGRREGRLAFRRLAAAGGRSLLGVVPAGGRLHQIRAQLAAAGWPLAGDRRYGARTRGSMLLHLAAVHLPHPVRGTALRIQAPLPPHLAQAFGAAAEVRAAIAAWLAEGAV